MNSSKYGPMVEKWVAPPAPSGEILSGRFAHLEPISASRHANDLFAAYSQDDAVWDYLPYGPYQNRADYTDWVRSMEQSADPFFYTVCEAGSKRAVGVASFMRIDAPVGVIEVGGINFAPVMQKRPIGTEAIFLMMKWAFEAGYRRFEWKCDALNVPSRRAAQRFGFSYEGTFRQATIYKGRNRDTAWFAMIDSEWPALKETYSTWFSPENFDENSLQRQSLADLTQTIRVTNDPALSVGS